MGVAAAGWSGVEYSIPWSTSWSLKLFVELVPNSCARGRTGQGDGRGEAGGGGGNEEDGLSAQMKSKVQGATCLERHEMKEKGEKIHAREVESCDGIHSAMTERERERVKHAHLVT